MKKLSALFVCIILIFSFSLVGCSGQSVAFVVQNLDPVDDVNSVNLGIEFGNLFNSRDELIEFYDKDVFDGIDKESELAGYGDNYFKNKSLIAVIFVNDKNANSKIKSLSRKGDELRITLQNTGMKEFNEVARFFLEVDKKDVDGINEINYTILTIK